MKIIPINKAGQSKTGELNGVTVEGIKSILGFPPNVEDDPEKVQNSWGFMYLGKEYGVWDYKGSANWHSFSTWGDHEGLRQIFGSAYRALQ